MGHIRDTTVEINAQVSLLRDALVACNPREQSPVRASSPCDSRGRSQKTLRARPRTLSPPSRAQPRQRTPQRRWGLGWGAAAAVAAGSSIRELLARLTVQAEASDASGIRPVAHSILAEKASETVGHLLERHLGISCTEPTSPLRAWFSSASSTDLAEHARDGQGTPELENVELDAALDAKEQETARWLPVFMVDLVSESVDEARPIECSREESDCVPKGHEPYSALITERSMNCLKAPNPVCDKHWAVEFGAALYKSVNEEFKYDVNDAPHKAGELSLYDADAEANRVDARNSDDIMSHSRNSEIGGAELTCTQRSQAESLRKVHANSCCWGFLTG